MSMELFPAEAVTMDSPRRAWALRHGVRLHESPGARTEGRWCAWIPANDAPALGSGPTLPRDMAQCGFGPTDEEALLALAAIVGLPTWLLPIPTT